MESTLDDLIASTRRQRLHTVDAREWNQNWSDKWVAFVDLVGIAARSTTSTDATVNQMVRFHRALSTTAAKYPMVHLFRFTDAAYATSEQPEHLIKFVSDLHHFCLAMNHIQLERPKCFFHHLIVARTTIAFGPVLEAHGRLPVEDRFLGVDATSLLIGKGVVDAYRLEKRTAGDLVSVSRDQVRQIKALPVRGTTRPPRRVLERWTAEDDFLSHDGVVDIPWMLLRPEQPTEAGLWAATYDDVLAKLRLLVKVWGLSYSEYTTQRLPIESVKHYGAVNRHLNELFQGLRQHTRLKAWSLAKLEGEIEQEQSRRGI